MKLKNKIVTIFKIAIVFIAATFVSSCDEEFIVEIDDTSNLIVVNSFFNGDEELSVTVTKSMPPQKNQVVVELKNAKVSLFENNNFVEELTYLKTPNDSIGRFISNTTPVIGATYRIEAETPEEDIKQKVSTQSVLPERIEIVSDTAVWLKWTTEKDSTFLIRFYFEITFNDPPADNYYYITAAAPVYEMDTINNTREFCFWEYAEILTGELPGHELYINNALLFKDATFNSTTKKISGTATMHSSINNFNSDIDENKKYFIDKSKLHIVLHSLSKDAYNFCSSYAKKIEMSDDIYSEPVVIYSNVKNGLGIFAGENISSKDIPIKY
jgi:hypothetical protein